MKKKPTLTSLILAAALVLTGCNSANELPADAVASIAESAAQSAVESALAEISASGDSAPLTSPDVSETADTTTPAETTAVTTTTATTTAVTTTTAKTTAATTTKAANTSATTTKAATADKTTAQTTTEEPVFIDKIKITNEYMVQVTNLKTSVSNRKYASGYQAFYNFNKKLSTGFDPTNIGYNVNKMIALETDRYGIIGEVTGDFKVKLRVYNNTGKSAKLTGSYIENAATSLDGKWFENKLKLNEDVVLDLSTLPTVKERPRTWVVRATLKVDKKSVDVWTFIWTNVDETWLCAKTDQVYSRYQFKKLKAERKELMDQFSKDKIDPKNELAVLGFMHYPRPDFDKPDKNKDETEDWVKLVKSIDVSGMSDDRKVWTAYEWINNNIAYDYWEYNNCRNENNRNMGRARYFNDWSGKYDTYQQRCGVCWDMANLMAIFCRTWGIPTVVISDKSHAWCAVYLNGRWTELDCTLTQKYDVNTEDVNVRTEHKYRRYDYLSTVGRINPDKTLKTINESLACCPGWSDLSKSFSA